MTTKCIDTINPKVFFADAKEIWIAVALLLAKTEHSHPLERFNPFTIEP